MNDQFDQIIEIIAEEHETSVSDVRNSMIEAIHAGFMSTDPVAREKFRALFGDKEPSIEEFLYCMFNEVVSRIINEQDGNSGSGSAL